MNKSQLKVHHQMNYGVEVCVCVLDKQVAIDCLPDKFGFDYMDNNITYGSGPCSLRKFNEQFKLKMK